MTDIASGSQTFLKTLQLDVRTRGGCKANIHSVRRLITTHTKNDNMTLLQVYLTNAFNVVDRKELFSVRSASTFIRYSRECNFVTPPCPRTSGPAMNHSAASMRSSKVTYSDHSFS